MPKKGRKGLISNTSLGGWTPLNVALTYGDLSLLDHLIRHNVEITRLSAVALWPAIRKNQYTALRMLFDYGAIYLLFYFFEMEFLILNIYKHFSARQKGILVDLFKEAKPYPPHELLERCLWESWCSTKVKSLPSDKIRLTPICYDIINRIGFVVASADA